MNATLANDVRHEQSNNYVQHPQPVRRVGLVDRAALHVGVALIKWGRRPVDTAPQLERRANRLERAVAGQARDERANAHREAVRNDYALQLRMR